MHLLHGLAAHFPRLWVVGSKIAMLLDKINDGQIMHVGLNTWPLRAPLRARMGPQSLCKYVRLPTKPCARHGPTKKASVVRS